MSKYIKYGLLFARIVLGLTFLFSGFVKAIDPLGSVYKFSEYFLAFGWGISENIVQLLALAQAAFEFTLGVLLLFGVWNKLTKWTVFLFMLVMTPFTLYIALENPVTDCGCFGDVLVITNWQTFLKNIFLLLLSVSLLIGKGGSYKIFGERTSRWTILWSLLFSALLSVHAYRHLPLVDFGPYRIGNDLRELTQLPPNAVTDSFDYKFIYEKEGARRSFSVNEIPQEISGWKYIEREQVLIREGDRPVIDNLNIEHPERGSIRDEILNDTSFVFLFISAKLETVDRMNIDNANAVYKYAQSHGYVFYGLTASNASAIDEWSYQYDTGFEFCSLDDKVSELIIRSNPGLLLLKDGIVIHKWASRDIPDFGELKVSLEKSSLGNVKKLNSFRIIIFLAIFFMAPLIFFYLLHTGHTFHLKNRKKKKNIQNNQV